MDSLSPEGVIVRYPKGRFKIVLVLVVVLVLEGAGVKELRNSGLFGKPLG